PSMLERKAVLGRPCSFGLLLFSFGRPLLLRRLLFIGALLQVGPSCLPVSGTFTFWSLPEFGAGICRLLRLRQVRQGESSREYCRQYEVALTIHTILFLLLRCCWFAQPILSGHLAFSFSFPAVKFVPVTEFTRHRSSAELEQLRRFFVFFSE